MRVALDARLSSYRLGGIPEYTRQLVGALRGQLRPTEQLTLIRHRKPPLGAPVDAPAGRRVWTPPHNRWEQLILPLELAGLGADVIHFPDFIPLFRLRTPTIITVHDLAFVRYPQILDAAATRYYGQIGRAVAHASAIIAVSASTRADLITLLGADADNIVVIGEAAAPHFGPRALGAAAERTINGERLHADTFGLFVGTVEPRKNLLTLLEALATLRDRGDRPTPQLVVAGARGWLDGDIGAAVARLGLADAVRFVGAVGDDELVWLYNACRVYLHPELYSGFGLPVLEALQCGAPAIVADTSSLPEVTGDAALLLPPLDTAAWAATWERVWADAQLRAELRERGLRQAARFRWETAADATLALYRRVAGSA